MNIITGECVEVMQSFEDNSIDCIITSPPYDGIRRYGANYNKSNCYDIERLGFEIERTLKDGCFAVVVISDQKKNKRLSLTTMRLTLNWVDSCNLTLCDWLIYKRQGRIGKFHSFRRDHESILVFFKGKNPKDINTQDLKKNSKRSSDGVRQAVVMREKNDSITKKYITIEGNKTCRGSVWEYMKWGNHIKSREEGYHLIHPAMMREELARDLVIAFSTSGDIILDPFCGSGTTGLYAKKLGREFIGIDISEEYCNLAKNRIESYQCNQLNLGEFNND